MKLEGRNGRSVYLEKCVVRLEGRRFVRRNVFLRPIPRASERAMANGREERRKNNAERGWESDPEYSRAFSFRRFASGVGIRIRQVPRNFVGFIVTMTRPALGSGAHAKHNFARGKILMRKLGA